MGWFTRSSAKERAPGRTLLDYLREAKDKSGYENYYCAIEPYNLAVEHARKHKIQMPQSEVEELKRIYSARAQRELEIYGALLHSMLGDLQLHLDEAKLFAKASGNKTIEQKVRDFEAQMNAKKKESQN